MTARREVNRGAKRLLLFAVTAIASLLALPAAAQALPEGYHYEMVSPPDKNGNDVGAGLFWGQYFASPDGEHLAYNSLGGWGNAGSNGATGSYAASRGEEQWSNTSLLLNMAPGASLAMTNAPAVSNDFSTALSQTSLNQETGEAAVGFTPFTYKMDVPSGEIELFSVADQNGNEVYTINNTSLRGNDDFSRIVYQAPADLVNDGLATNANRLFLQEEGDVSLVSILPNDDPVVATMPGSHLRPVSAEADIAFFNTTTSGVQGLYRRDINGESTDRVNADENPDADPPAAAATFSGASADAEIAYFVSNQQLVADDTNAVNDLYRYDQSQPEGSRLTLISVDDEGGDTAGAVADTFGVSADGETVVFSHHSQLVPGEPSPMGNKLYVYTDEELRYIGPAAGMPTGSSARRAIKLSEDGETLAFLSSNSTLSPEDNGGFHQVYVYDVANDAPLECASCLPSGANTTAAAFMMGLNISNNLVTGDVARRVVSEEGHVFFQTEARLVPEDTNGKYDVYAWQDGEIELISSGRSHDNSLFMDASLDGSSVFFMTREQLSGWDRDKNLDAYAARTGEALPEPTAPPPPCEGDDCQNEAPAPPEMPEPGTGSYEGPGNPEFADCSALEADAEAAQQKAKKLKKKAKKAKKKAKKASGKKAKKLKKKAKKANKKAKKANKQAKQARQQLDNCRSNG